MKQNEQDGILVEQHGSIEDRIEVGQTCMEKLALEMPAVVDEMDDAVARAYGAMPERLYLIAKDGTVAYKGGVGPMFFRPKDWEQAIADNLS